MINSYSEAIETLMLSRGASQEQIKDAFRSLSKIYHPDVYRLDNGEKFKRINQAYQYLKKYPEADSYVYRREEYSTNEPFRSAREQKRQRAYETNWKKKKHIQAQYNRFFSITHKPILIIAILNFVLVLDYFLPHYEWTSTLVSIEKIADEKGHTELFILHFENEELISLSTAQMNQINVGDKYEYAQSTITQQKLSFKNLRTSENLRIGYNSYKPFAFLIIIVVISLSHYFKTDNRYTKLNSAVIILFLGMCQIFILLSL